MIERARASNVVVYNQWQPDTCGCSLSYRWVRAVSVTERVHVPFSVAPCPAHATSLSTRRTRVLRWLHRHKLRLSYLDHQVFAVFESAQAENQRKNMVLATLLQDPALADLRAAYVNWRGVSYLHEQVKRYDRVLISPMATYEDWAPGVDVGWAIDEATRVLTIVANVQPSYVSYMRRAIADVFPGVRVVTTDAWLAQAA